MMNGSSSNTLSVDELRRKRLAALSSNGNTSTRNSASVEMDGTSRSMTFSNGQAEVVDLCDSSSDQDETEEAGKPAAARPFRDSEQNCHASRKRQAAEPPRMMLTQKPIQNEKHQPVKKERKSSSIYAATKVAAAATKTKNTVQSKKTSSSDKKNAQETFKKPASSSTEGNTTHFQVATWNVWFGPPNLNAGEPHASARMKALARHLLKTNQDPLSLSNRKAEGNSNTNSNPLWVIGFQEVIDELAVHLFPLLESNGYQIFRQPGDAPYGCALAIYTKANTANSVHVLDASWQPYSITSMARGFLYARIQHAASGQQLLFCTTHLESWVGKDHPGAQERVRQLQELEAFCNRQLQTYSNLQTCIITGDMNWDDERRSGNTDASMASIFKTRWSDSWLATKAGGSAGKKETCYTYDGKLNPMLSNSLRRRFDRCMVRNTEAGTVESIGTRLVGTEAIVGLKWQKVNPYTRASKEMPTAPSDHFGLVVQMAITK